MNAMNTVLVVGRSKEQLDNIVAILKSEPCLEVSMRLVVNGHMDALQGVQSAPSILILDLSGHWEEELKALTIRPVQERPHLIVVGPEGNTQVFRMAMQAGARDFFTHPVPPGELLASVLRIAQETAATKSGGRAKLVAVINAKGGSGASFIACNVAHCMAAHLRAQTALIDLDLQFGVLPLYLDLAPQGNLLAALTHADQLDAVALEGHMLKHKSGLRLLASMNEDLALPWEVSEESLQQLLLQLMRNFEYVVADLPRQIDPLTSRVIERADHVLLVTEQSIGHVRDAKHMVRIMTRELAVPSDRVHVVINRHDKRNPVTVGDITASTKADTMFIVPNDYQRVSESINLGIPLYEGLRSAAITKSVLQIVSSITGDAAHAPRGRLKSMFDQLLAR